MDDSCQWNKRDRYDARLLPTISPDGVHNQDIGCAVESVWQTIPYEIRDGPVPYTVSQIVNDPRRSYGFAPSVDGDGLTTKQQVDADAAEQEEYPPKGLCSRISGFRGLVRHVCAAFSFDMTLQIYGKKSDHANNSLSFFSRDREKRDEKAGKNGATVSVTVTPFWGFGSPERIISSPSYRLRYKAPSAVPSAKWQLYGPCDHACRRHQT